MTNQPHNTQELDEIIREMRYRVLEDNGLTVNGLTTIEQETKQAITDWHNKQVEEATEKAFTRGYISGGIDELDRFLKER